MMAEALKGGGCYPAFMIYLDLARGDAHSGFAEVCICLAPNMAGQFGQIHSLLAAGQHKIEGGFPCMAPCTGRHPPMLVERDDGDGWWVPWGKLDDL